MRHTLSMLSWAVALALPLAARANTGDLDPSFGAGGQVITPISSGYDGASALVVQPDGKLVAAGHAYNASNTIFALVRYNTDGSRDETFGTSGKVTTAVGIGSAARALVLQPDGKLVAAGHTFTGSRTQFALVRYNATGSLDTSFGTGGKVGTPVGSIDDEVFALVLQPDGKLVAAGYTDKGSSTAFALVRYNANGSLDTSFGTGGKVTTPIGSVDDEVFALVLQPDGKLVAAGYTSSASSTAFALVRYNADGSLDTSFGTGGKVTTSIESIDDEAFALVLQPDGKLVAVGYANDGSNEDFAVVRYSANGSLDASFGTGGRVITSISGSYGEASALVLQPDGNLVAAGYAYNGSNNDFILVRYLGQVCGDGIVQASEQCDDGAANGELTSCCTTTCQLNGIVACTTTTTTTTSSTTSTTTPCPDSGFEGVGCMLRTVIQPCADETMPRAVQHRITQVTRLVDHGAGAIKRKKASTFARKASKTLKKAVRLAVTATAKGQLSVLCGDALSGVLQEAERRAEQLAPSP